MPSLETLLKYNLPETAQTLVNVILLWIGFAMVVGLIARTLVPGQLMRGPWTTFLLGLTSCCLSSLFISDYYGQERYNPIGLVGFCAAIITGIIVLISLNFLNFVVPPRDNKRSDVEEDLESYEDFKIFRDSQKK